MVVNCSQIFCTFAVETTKEPPTCWARVLWIALKFFVLLQSKQLHLHHRSEGDVVNCSQIFCTFAVETTVLLLTGWEIRLWIALKFFVLLQSKQLQRVCKLFANCCELLSNFLYFCSRNNIVPLWENCSHVVNCSQIFCTFAVETTACACLICSAVLWIALKFFVLLQSKQHLSARWLLNLVVNCSQIFCTFAVETTKHALYIHIGQLWIALKFFVLLQSKQHDTHNWLWIRELNVVFRIKKCQSNDWDFF